MLTGRQQEIWDFLVDYVDRHGYPPTVREIGDAVGLASPSTVHAHLANLERAGLLKRDPTKPRRVVSPRTQQRGLPTSRRRRDDRQTFGHGAVEQPKEIFPVEQAPGARNVSCDRLRHVLPALPRHQVGHVGLPAPAERGPELRPVPTIRTFREPRPTLLWSTPYAKRSASSA